MAFLRKFLVYILPLIILLFQLPHKFQLNNTCTNFDSYLQLYFSENCYHSPDNNANTLQIIKRYTNTGEDHKVLTEDGYILTVFRIPTLNPRGVILLQHGVSHDSRYFVAQQNESIALYFWRAQYDVWLLNCRGTSYSQNHTNLTIENEKFWDYTFHEVGIYDISASVQYIKNVTDVKKIIYVGLSMGASAGSVYASLRPEEAEDSVKLIVNLAPFYFTTNATLLINYVLFGWSQFLLDYKINTFLNCHYLLEPESWHIKLAQALNRVFPFKRTIMYLTLFFFGGYLEEFDPKHFNLLFDQLGSAFSLKMFAHLYQLTVSQGNFQMYDYRREKNMEMYGRERPPLYPLKDIRVPIYILYGEKDKLVPPEDVEMVYDQLPERVKIYGKEKVERFGHHDFVFGLHRNERVYNKILNVLKMMK